MSKNNTGTSEYYSLMRSPFSQILGMMGNVQFNVKCREFELNVLDCTDVYGHKGMLRQCIQEYEDFKECIASEKQINRSWAMERERMRQYMRGERTKENRYAEAPKVDSFDKTYINTLE